jgi:hypothetical protein
LGGRTGLAAWTAVRARQAGYPDLAGATARVLATRPTAHFGTSAQEITDTLAKAAAVLSLTDPVGARELLARAAPAGRPGPDELAGRRDVLIAFALADPERATALVDRLIDQAGQRPTGLQGSGLIELLDTLTTPPADRLRPLGDWLSLVTLADDRD